jgi:hypothetical protein
VRCCSRMRSCSARPWRRAEPDCVRPPVRERGCAGRVRRRRWRQDDELDWGTDFATGAVGSLIAGVTHTHHRHRLSRDRRHGGHRLRKRAGQSSGRAASA